MNVEGNACRTVVWEEGTVVIVDQLALPHRFALRRLEHYEATARAIELMWVRGAPAIGATAAFGMVQAIWQAPPSHYREIAQQAAQRLRATRPTAQNLFFAIERILQPILEAPDYPQALQSALQTAQQFADDDVASCAEIGRLGNELIGDGDSILTHCNAGWLACVDWGTALSPLYTAFRAGKKIFVYVDETRPRGQGANLTAWELGQEGLAHAVIADNAAGYYLAQGKIQLVIVGADRIAANGDVANKIGTLTKAVLAQAWGVPFYVAAPLSTFDFQCASGLQIPIEERSADEVHYTWGLSDAGEHLRVRTTPKTSTAKNPAFDVTPARLITGIITEKGIFAPAEVQRLNPAFQG